MRVKQLNNQLFSSKMDLQQKVFKIKSIEERSLLESGIEIQIIFKIKGSKSIWIIIGFNNLELKVLGQGNSRK